jgi:SAM-dependent methyltransferase
MGIGPEAISIYEKIVEKNILDKMNSVIELGSQDIPCHEYYQNAARLLLAKLDRPFDKTKLMTAKDFHIYLGFSEYCSIDSNGKMGALQFDLNKNIKTEYNFDRKFDLITNHGTTEHVFDQCSAFRNIHNLVKEGGVMLHIVPFEGYLNHGLFNYQPSFFYNLASENNYKIEGIYYTVAAPVKWNKLGRSKYPIPYTNRLMDVLKMESKRGRYPYHPNVIDTDLCVIFRKTNNDEFRLPFDNRFRDISKLDSYDKIISEEINSFIFRKYPGHEKDVIDAMGYLLLRTRLPIWLKSFLKPAELIGRIRSLIKLLIK